MELSSTPRRPRQQDSDLSLLPQNDPPILVDSDYRSPASFLATMWSGEEEPASTNSPLPVSSTSPAPVSRRKRHKPHRRSTPQPHSRTSEPPVVVSEKDSLGSLPKSRNAKTNVSGSTDSSSEDLRTDFHPDARVEGLKDLCCVTFPNIGANPSETASPDFVNPESVSPLSDNPISDFSGCAKTELRSQNCLS